MTPAAATARRPDALPVLLIALAAVIALAGLMLAFRPAVHVFDTPLTEDSYYSLAVARNIAAGIGVTIDGTQPTNGFQPLFTFMEAACYWLAGGEETFAIRLVLALSWAIYVGTAGLVGAIAADAAADEAGRRLRRWLAGLLYLGGFLTFMHHFNGLETGLLLLCYAAAWRAWQVGVMERSWGPAVFGLLLGLTVLTRIDAAVFVAVFCAWQFLAELRRGLRPAILRAGTIGVAALAISAPWWGWNYLEFGSLMPTSGTAQQEWALDGRRLRWIFWALGVTGMPSLWLGRFDEVFHDGLLPSLLRAVVGIALLWGFALAWRRRAPAAGGGPAARTWQFAAALAAALCLLCLYYGFSFIAYWFYYRYLFPAALLGSVGIAWLLQPAAARRPVIAAVLACLLTAPTLISMVMAQRGETLHVQTVYWEQLQLIDEQVPVSDAVAAGQAGTLGYFRRNVVNVDGKVNRRVIAHQGRMWDYLEAQKVRWFCDWPFYVEKYLGPDPTANGWRHVGQKGYWQLWKYEG